MTGWNELYVPGTKKPSPENTMQAKVFDQLKKIDEMKVEWGKASHLNNLKYATGTEMDRIVACILDILEANHDMHYDVFKDRKAMKGIAEAFQNLPTSLSAPTIPDVAPMGSDAVMTLIAEFKESKKASKEAPKKEYKHHQHIKGSALQKEVIEFSDRTNLPPQLTVTQWAQGLMPIAEEAMHFIRYAGAEKAPGLVAKFFKEVKAQQVSELNRKAMVQYVTEVRPALYFYMTTGKKMKVSEVR